MAPGLMKAQPGPGAPTGGTGKDSDGGKTRTQFEDDRRTQNQGGKDRPPVYKPSASSKTIPAKSGKKVITKPGASNALKLAVQKYNVDNGHFQY